MYRGRGAARGGRGSGGGSNGRQRAGPKGLFADGNWHCECTPRLPAEHFKVKKNGPNHGRWFYTCQMQEDKRCGFFLWDEDAKPREESAVLNGRRTEPGVQDGWNAGRDRPEQASRVPQGTGLFAPPTVPRQDDSSSSDDPPPPYTIEAQSTGRSKRSAREAHLDYEDEFEDWTFSGEDERRLARAADNATPATPHKVQRIGVYDTPITSARRKLPWLEQPASEASSSRQPEDYFTTPSKQPVGSSQTQSTVTDPGTPYVQPTIPTASTPSPPTRHKDALYNPADDASSLTSEVLSALSHASIPPATRENLRTILTRHDLRNQGVKKGRDISRLALKAKDAKIAELQAKIASLEADMELERGLGRLNRSGRDG